MARAIIIFPLSHQKIVFNGLEISILSIGVHRSLDKFYYYSGYEYHYLLLQRLLSYSQTLDNLLERDEFLGYEYLSQCASHPNFMKFEECLESLQNVDLFLLATDEDKIIFYTNIVNSLNIHACITQSVLMKRRGEDLSIFGVTTMFSFFIQSCYSLGQLGIVK